MLTQMKAGCYLREAGERRSVPKLISPIPEDAQDTACDPMARKCALHRLHAREKLCKMCGI